jgi:uncharacterized membrane protein
VLRKLYNFLEVLKKDKFKISTRTIVISAIMVSLYVVLTLFLAPISFGPLQFRVANLLYGLIVIDPIFIPAMVFGVFFSNLASPFGILDWGVMPFITLLGCLFAYGLKEYPWLGLSILAVVISYGVAFFPLGFGAGLPFLPTFLAILTTQLVSVPIGYYIIWNKLVPVIKLVIRR